ncbi:MAG: ATP-binding cassette domain-containing protein [Gemmatimonadaceae bacterium]
MTAPLLVADSVGKHFGAKRVLTSASLRAVPGEVRVLFGRNGAGKSTLIKIAAGLITPDTGMVHFDGAPLLRASLPWLARAGVFYLPDHELLSSALTLGDQLRLCAAQFGLAESSWRDAARRTQVESLTDRRPTAFSGGELRRAELTLALARGPRVLIADEPFRGIAPVDHELLATLFRALAATGCAVVVTGHEIETLLALADHITWSTSGTTYELGSRERALAHEQFRREYAGRVS